MDIQGHNRKISRLLDELSKNDVLLEVVNGVLRIGYSGAKISVDLLSQIRDHRDELIKLLAPVQNSNGKQSYQQTIPNLPHASDYCLSSSQQRIWTICQFPGGSRAYNMPIVCMVEGFLIHDALRLAFQAVIERHEILRTSFFMNEEGEVRQKPIPAKLVDFRLESVMGIEEKWSEDQIIENIRWQLEMDFDLLTPPLIKACLYKTNLDTTILCCVIHHIAGDGWSMQVLTRELLFFYDQIVKRKHDELTPLLIQYKDYAAWERGSDSSIDSELQDEYWSRHFANKLELMNISLRKRPSVFSHHGAAIEFLIDHDLNQKLVDLATRYGGTVFMSILFFLHILLWRYTGQKKIVLGTSIADRGLPELRDQMGVYLNNLPLIGDVDPSLSLRDLFHNVRKMVVETLENQHYPFERLLKKMGYVTDPGRTGPFNVFVEFHSEYDVSTIVQHSEPQITPWMLPFQRTQFDISFMFIPEKNGLKGTIIYSTDLFEELEVTSIKDRLLGTIKSVLSVYDEKTLVGDIPFWTMPSALNSGNQLKEMNRHELF